jgi:hypothetical protein
VLSNFTARNIDVQIAAVPGAKWASPREFIKMFMAVFDYAFNKLGAARVTGLIRAKNEASRRFSEHVGLKLEGIMRESFDDDDLCVYGFLKKDFKEHRWNHGK